MSANCLTVPLIRQSDDSLCGPASLWIVLTYLGFETTERDLAVRSGHTYELGCDAAGMKKAAESFGCKVTVQDNSSLEDIDSWLGRRVPVIVDWFSSGAVGRSELRSAHSDLIAAGPPDGHSSVVVGLDSANVYLADPEIGDIRRMTRDDFMRVWFDWRVDRPFITSWEDMIMRQMIVIQRGAVQIG